MTFIAITLCLFIVAMGAVGLADPQRLFGFIRRFQTPGGLWAAAGIRILLGIALYVVAPETQAPHLVRGLGVFVFVAGVITPMFGVERFGRMLDWWASRGDAFARAWSAFALAFGAGLVWLVLG